jgi:hypothetical protein
MEVSNKEELSSSEEDQFGIFPIEFALGGCKETLGLSKHKVARHSEREKIKSNTKTKG